VELTRAETALAAVDTDCAGAAAVLGDPDGAVTDDPAATLVAEGVGAVAAEPAATVLGDVTDAVTDVAAAGLETLAATGAGVALGLATLAVDA